MNLTAAAALNSSVSPSSNGRSQFELRVGPFVGNELTVVSFTGHEALNEPFTYEVTFSSRLPEYVLHVGTRGLPACLSVHTPAPHEPRVIQGLVVDFGATDTPSNELAAGAGRYFVRVAPRVWTLRNNSKRRVFQCKTAIEIVCSVLHEYDITPDVQLRKASYPPIPFEYQRQETDLEFISRILATAGIFSYFRHATGLLDAFVPGGGIAASELAAATSATSGLGGGIASASGFLSDAESTLGVVTTLVLTDQAASTEQLGDTSVDLAQKGLDKAGGAAAAAIPGPLGQAAAGVVGVNTGVSDPLVYDANGQAGYTDAERVFSFAVADPLVPKQIRLRHWNLGGADSFNATTKVAPVSANVTVNAIATLSLTQPADIGLNVEGSARADAPSIAPRQASVFEYGRDGGLQDVPATREGAAASRALAQARAGTLPGWGTTDCRRLAPGYRFTLQGHPLSALNVEYLVTEVRTQASNPDYATSANSRDYVCTFRCVPSYVDPLPKKPAPKEYGPEPAVVIGPNWGQIYCDDLNRILVRFRWASGDGFAEDGEGVCRVHLLEVWGGNRYGFQAIPRVGSEVMVSFFEGGEPIATGQIRSQANKPAFSDPHAASKVGIRSQVLPDGPQSEITIDDHPNRNQILVSSSGDLRTEVMRDTNASHGGNYAMSVGGTRREVTNGPATLLFDSDVTTDTTGSLRNQVAKDRVVVTDGTLTEWVGGNAQRSVLGNVEAMTQGDHRATYEETSLERHYGHHTVIVAAPSQDVQASTCLHVEGDVRAYAKRLIEAVATDGFSIRCGESHITIRKDSVDISSPTITLNGNSVTVTATDKAALVSKTSAITSSDAITLTGANQVTVSAQSAFLVLDTNATLKGSEVKLGGSASSSTSQQSKKTTKTTVTLTEAAGNPIPNERVTLRKGGAGGPERSAVLNAKGSLEIEGSDPLDIRFDDCRLATDPPGIDDVEPYIVRQGDFVGLLSARYGFDADALWDHSKNEALQKAGRDPGVLQPNDVLYISRPKRAFRSLTLGSANPFIAPAATTTLTLSFVDPQGKPLVGESCAYEGLYPSHASDAPLTTDSAGHLKLIISVRQGSFGVIFPAKSLRFFVFVGHLDPSSEASGVQKRLEHLGYGAHPVANLGIALGLLGDASAEESLRQQILAFQFDRRDQLTPNGALDDPTAEALARAHEDPTDA